MRVPIPRLAPSVRALCISVLVGSSIGLGASQALGQGPSRPNILLLVADDQRADTIAAWGNPHIRTPNLDRLARHGTSFRANYCFGSNSGAVCVPSRAMLFSGRTWLDVPHDLQGVKLLPELLREGRYHTFATGKWHNGESSCVRAFPRGKSIFFGGMADHTKVPVADVRNGQVVNRRIAEKFSSEQFADAAVDFLKSQSGDGPFFCYVAFTAPHDPRNPPEPFREMYYRNRPPLPENFLPQHPFDNGMARDIRDENLAPYPRTREVIGDQLCEYYGLITHLDEQVGRILAALEDSGQADDTIIIYTSDHGLALGSHGLLGKQSLYEHSMRSPLIIAGPGIPAGRSTAAFTYLFDLLPTICAFAGVKPPDGLAGRDLRPLWQLEGAKIRDSVFLPFSNLMRSVRDDRWKLIVYPPINHRQLFDLRDDPHEMRDLAADPGHEPEIARLTGLMRSWQEKLGDEQPLAVSAPKPKELRFDDLVRKPDEWQPAWIVEKYFRDRWQPNIIIFLADDLGYGDLACYGHPRIQSPNLDAFARQGARLTQCYAASAVCSPSRSAILTGRTPHRNGVYTWIAEGSEVHLPASEITLAKLLKQAGYATCHVGKWHLNGKFNDPAQPQPNDHGYEHWMATQNNAAPSHKDPVNFVRNGQPLGKLEGYSARLVVDEAIHWLTTKRDKAKPFFLAVWTHEPHLPIETDPRFQAPYEDLAEDFRQHHGNVTQLDHAFGVLMKALGEQGLADTTFVFFTSDNGPEGDGTKGRTRGSAGGLRGRKRSLYEGGIRVPGIVRWPGRIPPGLTVDVPVIGSDLFPTILGIAGVKPPGDRVIDGANVLPVLTGQAATAIRKRPLYWRLNMAPAEENLQMALREGDWKLLAAQDFSHIELYNLKADPEEKKDLAAKEAKRLGAMRETLQKMNAAIEREGPDWWKRLSPNGGGPIKKQ